MAAPDYVPVSAADRVRQGERLPAPRGWLADRPGEIAGLLPPDGGAFGVPGPDQGYGLKLAKRFLDKLVLTEGEHVDDVVAGSMGVALKRAALFGRAPVIHDFDVAFSIFGFLGDAPADLVTHRKALFSEAGHNAFRQRGVVAAVADDTLRMTPAQVRDQVRDWRALLRPAS